VRLAALLAAPMAWLVVAYLGSLAVMFAAAFWSTDSFTGALIKQASWTTSDAASRSGLPADRAAHARRRGDGDRVDVVIALPIAFYMAKVAGRGPRLLVAAILTPLWASYLVKAYAWRDLLSRTAVDWALGRSACHGPGTAGRGDADAGVPVAAVHDPADVRRLDRCRLAAGGLRRPRAPAGRTFRSVVLPLIFPALVAGSIFTFSLSLGDYITVKIVGGRSSCSERHLRQHRRRGEPPFAAAAAVVPVAVICSTSPWSAVPALWRICERARGLAARAGSDEGGRGSLRPRPVGEGHRASATCPERAQ
jgi:putative spermidine/putrescine transport system permease protein